MCLSEVSKRAVKVLNFATFKRVKRSLLCLAAVVKRANVSRDFYHHRSSRRIIMNTLVSWICISRAVNVSTANAITRSCHLLYMLLMLSRDSDPSSRAGVVSLVKFAPTNRHLMLA